jgi:phosphatidylglycerophosphate synthase
MHPWRERLARWFTPLARRTPLSPNAITFIAFALNVIGAVCLAYGAQRPALFLIAIVFIAVSGFADALDGIVARVQNKTSRFGDFLDHCADRAGDTLLAACWLAGNNVRQPLAMAGIIMTMLNGYIGTQIEATYGERNYESIGRGEFVLGIIILPVISYTLFTGGWQALRFASLTVAEWLAVVMLLFAFYGVVQRFRVAARLERS